MQSYRKLAAHVAIEMDEFAGLKKSHLEPKQSTHRQAVRDIHQHMSTTVQQNQ